MKTIYVCKTCGSPEVIEECAKRINEDDEIISYDLYCCEKCGREGTTILAAVEAPDDFDIENHKWSFAEERWKKK